MADYKELLRKAVEALPENNGAARRAVYEKARSALVAQLRGLNPPLPAREITQHRLQLEDCIRQVEQEASEQLISGLRGGGEELPQLAPPAPPAAASDAEEHRPSQAEPAPVRAGRDLPAPPASRRAAPPPQLTAHRDTPRPVSRLASKAKPVTSSIEEIIAAADEEFPEEAPVRRPSPANGRAVLPAAEAKNGARLTAKSRRPGPHPDFDEDHEVIEAGPAVARAGSEIELFAPPPGERRKAAHEEGVADRDADDEGDEDDTPPAGRRKGRRAPEPEPAAGGTESRGLPSIVARAEAIRTGRGNGAALVVPEAKGLDRDRRGGPVIEPRREMGTSARAQAAARGAVAYSGEATAHKLHELEVGEAGSDPQSAIDRAIATLDREARGESAPVDEVGGDTVVELPAPVPDQGRKARRGAADEVEPAPAPERPATPLADKGFARPAVEDDRGGGSAITIFLLIFLILLIAACGGAFWAWHEGYIDFAAMFGKPAVQTESSASPAATKSPAKPAASSPAKVANTTSAKDTSSTPSAALKSSDRLLQAVPPPSADSQVSPAPGQAKAPPTAPVMPSSTVTAETNAADNGEVKSEDRLTSSAQSGNDSTAAGTANNPAAAAGSQSLLLEASDDGTTGAVPFSGTVEWSEGKDEMGRPTLVGKASIPARNLSVSVLIRKNSDPTLPASHLMEINFKVPDSFIGGSIAGLPGVLLKNEELVQGSPLVGASARVVGNSFLFALSSSPDDIKANVNLLTTRKWIDLAIIYATGKRAIITLEKDDKAQALFTKVFDAWQQPTG